ncbi:MAG: N-acetylmuramoyl-L-alanine amidase [bacterium]|nr:N-acetylmuramoyl-L-alanine amidase [bacterium]
MVLSKSFRKVKTRFSIFLSAGVLVCAICWTGCDYSGYTYQGSIIPEKHTWLSNKKIFIDPGHGGKGTKDRFRIGYGGITEEKVNIRVALILEDMLKKSGAIVKMSRRRDDDIPLDARVRMVKEFKPHILISIHHNGSPRRADRVNYPCVLIWGSKQVRPASYQLASYLREELDKIMDPKGYVLSDFSVFNETGTKILRETRYTCPGILGEGGFFTDEDHAMRLKDREYNEREAEAYYNAISRYLRWGVPTAEVLFSCAIDNSGYLQNKITDSSPIMAIKVTSGNEKTGIRAGSLKITLDGVPVSYKKIKDDIYLVQYGKKLYPGGHRLRFRFKNLRHQTSMILNACFTVEIKKGDYRRLIRRGKRLLRTRRGSREGLKMLLAALSMGATDPEADQLITHIARGFRKIGERTTSQYYYDKRYFFYPDSKYNKTRRGKTHRGYRYPVEYHGKKASIHGPVDFKTCYNYRRK